MFVLIVRDSITELYYVIIHISSEIFRYPYSLTIRRERKNIFFPKCRKAINTIK